MSHSADPTEWYLTASSTPRSSSPSARARAALAGPCRSSGGPGESAAHLANSSAGASRKASCSHTARSHRCPSESGTPSCSAQLAVSRATRCMCSNRSRETTAHSGRGGLSSASTNALRQTDVVDQTRVSYSGSNGDNRARVDRCNRGEPVSLDDRNVLHLDCRLGVQDLAHSGFQALRLSLAFAEPAVSCLESLAQHHGLAAITRIQVGVPAAQGETVGLADGRNSGELDRPIEVVHHSPDQ